MIYFVFFDTLSIKNDFAENIFVTQKIKIYYSLVGVRCLKSTASNRNIYLITVCYQYKYELKYIKQIIKEIMNMLNWKGH